MSVQRSNVLYFINFLLQSTMTARTDDDMSFSELRMSESESTAADTISTRSTISYQSSRSGLTRQGTVLHDLIFLYHTHTPRIQCFRSNQVLFISLCSIFIASTFRPLKQERKHGKSRSKGRQRSTVTGIPRHVQKELGIFHYSFFKQTLITTLILVRNVFLTFILYTLHL